MSGDVTPKTLQELREERGMTREELAVALKAPYNTVVNIELGRSRPRIQLAERIYQYFQRPVGTIIWKEVPKNKPATKVAA